MKRRKPKKEKRYFTPAEANQTLPLVRAIVRDIVDLAHSLRDRHTRLERLKNEGVARGLLTESQLEEEQAAFEEGQEKLQNLAAELAQLGAELKDPFVGLVDFPCRRDGREIYLCWKLDEPELGWWHEIAAGFPGRQPLASETVTSA
jgi:hypothetical protein